MLESVQSILDEYAELEQQLADPAVHGDQDLVRTLNKRYAALAPTVAAAREWAAAGDDLTTARELAADDESFAAEVPSLETRLAEAEEHLRRMLVPRDPDDDRDVILEVKAGEGGDESALFAGDLLRMYLRYAEQRGWRTAIEDATESDLGGYKDVRVSVRAKGTPLLIMGDPMFIRERTRIAELSIAHRVPGIFGAREYVAAGGLMFYNSSYAWHWRTAAGFVDKILKGAKPGDLPVQQPTQFDLAINLKTAKAMGITIPSALLQRANEVVE